eukprot:scaffold60841_cov59-Phaeocystis_antarctica.AAC.3
MSSGALDPNATAPQGAALKNRFEPGFLQQSAKDQPRIKDHRRRQAANGARGGYNVTTNNNKPAQLSTSRTPVRSSGGRRSLSSSGRSPPGVPERQGVSLTSAYACPVASTQATRSLGSGTITI